MSLAVNFSPESRETFSSIYHFVLQKFGERSAHEFALKTDKTIRLIAQNPLMYKASAIDKQVRIGIISKQTSVFYEVTPEAINLIFFWDNRQEPLIEP